MTIILSDAGSRLRALLAPYSQDTRLLRLIESDGPYVRDARGSTK